MSVNTTLPHWFAGGIGTGVWKLRNCTERRCCESFGFIGR